MSHEPTPSPAPAAVPGPAATNPATSPPAPASAPAPAPAVSPTIAPKRAQWTPAKQRIFLTALLETGSIARAAQAAGMSRSSAHRLRARLAGTPFDRTWDQALALNARRMADPFGPGAAGTRS